MNIRSNPEWDEKSPLEKRLNIVGIVIAFAVLIMAALQMAGFAKNLTLIFVPLMGLLMLIKAMEMWKNMRALAILCVVIATILFLGSVILAMAAASR